MNTSSRTTDVLVLGAGAAGLFCAAQAGQRGLAVTLLDHSEKPAEKVRISGGGRCNFTNIHTTAKTFLSENPHFAKSALARYTPQDFLDLLGRHEITWNDKGAGQLFCDDKSPRIIRMLIDEADAGNVEIGLGVSVSEVAKAGDGFRVETSHGTINAARLVIATGGLSIPKIGATPFAYKLAEQFEHTIVPTRPALVPLTFSSPLKEQFADMAGVALPVRATAAATAFEDAMLFTHRGLSGPAILQISSYWEEGTPITLDVMHQAGGVDRLIGLKSAHRAKSLASAFDTVFPKKFAAFAKDEGWLAGPKTLAETPDSALRQLGDRLSSWKIVPTGTEGYRTAEVTAGGVSTADLSSKTMESRHVPNLYFIGECVDVTGWLGGYNFQWAWASAHAAAEAMAGF